MSDTCFHVALRPRRRDGLLEWEGDERVKGSTAETSAAIVQELCESRGGRPELSVLTSLLVSVDVKIYWSQLFPNMSADIQGH